ncbi:MAG: LOG family protein [Anaerolineae bacterium]
MSSAVISVYGSSAPRPGSADYQAAYTVGRLLAQAGFAVLTGGYSGVMAAASQGAYEAGGHVIGATSARIERFRPGGANPWVKEEVRHQTLRDRLLYVVERCQGAIAMPGGVGTLSELSLIWSFVQVGEVPPQPIVAVGELWRRTLETFIDEQYIPPQQARLVTLAKTPEEAVAFIQAQVME